MSMILDAIKRSKEASEGGGSVPSLDTEHYVAPDRPIWKKAVFKRASLAALGVMVVVVAVLYSSCLLYTSPSPRDVEESRMPSSA